MSMRILSEDYVQKRLSDMVKKIHRVKRIKASNHEIELAKAEKAVWKRILYHIKNGEMMTIDEENRIEWHENASNA